MSSPVEIEELTNSVFQELEWVIFLKKGNILLYLSVGCTKGHFPEHNIKRKKKVKHAETWHTSTKWYHLAEPVVIQGHTM